MKVTNYHYQYIVTYTGIVTPEIQNQIDDLLDQLESGEHVHCPMGFNIQTVWMGETTHKVKLKKKHRHCLR